MTYNGTLPAGWVRSESLDWFPKEKTPPYQDLIKFTSKYNISFEFMPQVNAPGGYQIRLVGPIADVLNAIKDNWCSNEEGEATELLARTYIGDRLAEHRYHTGCKKTTGSRYERFSWDEHLKYVGVDLHASDMTDFDNNSWHAIDLLAEAGYEPSDGTKETEHQDFAQTYLALAMSHCPGLVDVLKRQEVQRTETYRHADHTECESDIVRYDNVGEGKVTLFICKDHDRRVYRV